MYKCAKSSHWGDRLPMTVIQREQLRSSRELYKKREKLERNNRQESDENLDNK